jgi:hypothetical protein
MHGDPFQRAQRESMQVALNSPQVTTQCLCSMSGRTIGTGNRLLDLLAHTEPRPCDDSHDLSDETLHMGMHGHTRTIHGMRKCCWFLS